MQRAEQVMMECIDLKALLGCLTTDCHGTRPTRPFPVIKSRLRPFSWLLTCAVGWPGAFANENCVFETAHTIIVSEV